MCCSCITILTTSCLSAFQLSGWRLGAWRPITQEVSQVILRQLASQCQQDTGLRESRFASTSSHTASSQAWRENVFQTAPCRGVWQRCISHSDLMHSTDRRKRLREKLRPGSSTSGPSLYGVVRLSALENSKNSETQPSSLWCGRVVWGGGCSDVV